MAQRVGLAAVHVGFCVINPSAAVPFGISFTFHVTPASSEPVTVAVRFCVPPPETVAVVGDMVTTVVPPLPPPLLGACAMQLVSGNAIAATINDENREARKFRKVPSHRQEAIFN